MAAKRRSAARSAAQSAPSSGPSAADLEGTYIVEHAGVGMWLKGARVREEDLGEDVDMERLLDLGAIREATPEDEPEDEPDNGDAAEEEAADEEEAEPVEADEESA